MLEKLNDLFLKGYRIETLNEVYGFSIEVDHPERTCNDLFLYRPKSRFVRIREFSDFPVNLILVEEAVSGRQYQCSIYDIF